MHHKLEHMKDVLICAVEHEINNLENANCKELGEAIDMIKDLFSFLHIVFLLEKNPKSYLLYHLLVLVHIFLILLIESPYLFS